MPTLSKRKKSHDVTEQAGIASKIIKGSLRWEGSIRGGPWREMTGSSVYKFFCESGSDNKHEIRIIA